MEIAISKPHSTTFEFEGECFLDMKYSFTLTKIVNNEGTNYFVSAHPHSSENNWEDWNNTKQNVIENIIKKHFEQNGAE